MHNRQLSPSFWGSGTQGDRQADACPVSFSGGFLLSLQFLPLSHELELEHSRRQLELVSHKARTCFSVCQNPDLFIFFIGLTAPPSEALPGISSHSLLLKMGQNSQDFPWCFVLSWEARADIPTFLSSLKTTLTILVIEDYNLRKSLHFMIKKKPNFFLFGCSIWAADCGCCTEF